MTRAFSTLDLSFVVSVSLKSLACMALLRSRRQRKRVASQEQAPGHLAPNLHEIFCCMLQGHVTPVIEGKCIVWYWEVGAGADTGDMNRIIPTSQRTVFY